MGSKNTLWGSLFSGWTGMADVNCALDRPAEEVMAILDKKIKSPQKSVVAPGNVSCSVGWSVLEEDEGKTNLKAKNGDLIFFISIDPKSKNTSDLHIRAVPAEGKMLSNFIATLGNPDVQTDRLVNYLLEGLQGK